MKRKDLYNYVRQEIINELSETTYAGKGAVEKIKKDPKFNSLNTSAKTNAVNDLNSGGDVELEEMARTPNNIKLGDPAKIAIAKKLYSGTWKGDMLDVVEKAGENGISQLELAKAVGKSSQPAINPSVNEFLKIGAFALTKSPTSTSTPSSIDIDDEPKISSVDDIENDEIEIEPETTPDEDEEEIDVKDDWEKSEEEEETAEEEPKMSDIKADDKEVEKISGGSTYAQKLSAEDEDKYTKLKKGIESKVKKLSQLDKEKREASDDLKILKQLIARDDVKKLFKAKGVSLKDLTSSIF